MPDEGSCRFFGRGGRNDLLRFSCRNETGIHTANGILTASTVHKAFGITHKDLEGEQGSYRRGRCSTRAHGETGRAKISAPPFASSPITSHFSQPRSRAKSTVPHDCYP